MYITPHASEDSVDNQPAPPSPCLSSACLFSLEQFSSIEIKRQLTLDLERLKIVSPEVFNNRGTVFISNSLIVFDR